MNLLTDVRANPVIGPVVSSERITPRKGLKNVFGSKSSKSVEEKYKKNKLRIFLKYKTEAKK